LKGLRLYDFFLPVTIAKRKKNCNSMNELEIIQGLKAANQRCFEIVYNEYYRPLVFFAHTHVQDGAVAHDITIDAFTKLWDRRGDFDSLQKIKAFLYITVRNASLNHIKQLERRNAAHKEILYLAEKDSDHLTASIYQSELLHRVMQEIKSLKGKARRIIELRYFEELPYPEIAKILNTTVENVRVQHSNTMHMLRLALKGKNLLFIAGIISCLMLI